MDQTLIVYDREPNVASEHHHLLCWKSSLAGLVVALAIFVLLSALGAGVAGFTAESLVSKAQGSGAGFATGAGLWLGISVAIAVFIGGFYTVRISRFVTYKVGAAHGLLIASLFALLMVFGLGNLVGGLATGFGKITAAAGESATDISQNPDVQDVLNRAMPSGNLKSDPKEFTKGLAVRLLSGNVESAKSYYAYQTGLPANEVDQKVAQLQSDFEAAAKTAGEKTAHAIGDTGILLFAVMLVAFFAAMTGGIVGAHSNSGAPFAVFPAPSTSTGFAPLANQRGSAVPYLIGWMMGVPISILFLIAMLRTVF